ncbi:MAG: glycerol-3-phosphate 1-O-acyltransferase PlsY [Gammaproteobacteria bacterium]|nr:glycerol-3-phosphate 1-O-acyltransferase PlsY [Gammaproteobacteria bacterium]MYD77093.1 glycerol-3-phosphate 1-O-acyltransferase PlsY [Gammaproteobacteria bacterium]MYJ51475.1 glycerol-3-phosphate 1-O-acyltransferase PlsY [Gammaproteobacteria bacterium]
MDHACKLTSGTASLDTIGHLPDPKAVHYTLLLFAYFLGSISCSVLICKLAGLPDPRHTGSNNPGATNVLRIGGKRLAVLALFGDILKGIIPVVVARLLTTDHLILSLVGLFAFVGHLYPVFFRFQGGKGVATAGGVYIALAWPVALALVGVWIAAALITRYSSVASLSAATVAPALIYVFLPDISYTLACCAIAALIYWRHRPNIARLRDGTESRIRLASPRN